MPILLSLYPVAIVLTLLSLMNVFIDSSRLIYRGCIYLTAIVGVVNALDIVDIKLGWLTSAVAALPFYELSLDWVVPAVACFIVSFIIHSLSAKRVEI